MIYLHADTASTDEIVLGLQFGDDDERVIALSLGLAEETARKLLNYVAAYRAQYGEPGQWAPANW